MSDKQGISIKKGRKKRKLQIFPCLIALFLIITLAGFINILVSKNAAATDNEEFRPMTEVIVDNGDTLWALTKKYCDYEGDIRKAIYEVQRINGLDNAQLEPGTVLRMPLSL